MQERKFREVCQAIDVDPEAAVPVQVAPGGQTYFRAFQLSFESFGLQRNTGQEGSGQHFCLCTGFQTKCYGGNGDMLGDMLGDCLLTCLLDILVRLYIRHLSQTCLLTQPFIPSESLIRLINSCNQEKGSLPIVDFTFRSIKKAMLKTILLDYQYSKFSTNYPRAFFQNTSIASTGFHLNALKAIIRQRGMYCATALPILPRRD